MISKKKETKTAVEYQGVIIADIFFNNFVPISLEEPPALFPVANVHLLDYSIEFLVSLRIKEIFVLCTEAHFPILNRRIESKKRLHLKENGLRIVPVNTGYPHTEADALRELDRKSLIKEDFILIRRCGIFGINIQPALRDYEAMKAEKKGYLMTMCFRELAGSCGDDYWLVEHSEDTPCVIMSEDKDVLDIDVTKKIGEHITIPKRVHEQQMRFSLHFNMIDASVDICSRGVLVLLEENFDWKDVRSQFVKGIFESDVIQERIHAHVLSSGYVGVPHTLKRYLEVSRQFMGRWAYPLTVESNRFDEVYSFDFKNIYRGRDAKIAITARLTSDVVVGQKSEIGEGTEISHSSLGSYCIVGKNVKIRNSIIWDEVKINDDVVIENSLVCCGAELKQGSSISKALISSNVIIGTGVDLPEGTRVKCGRLLRKVGAPMSPMLSCAASPKIGETFDKDVGWDGLGTIVPPLEDGDDSDLDLSVETEESRSVALISDGEGFYEEIRSTIVRDLEQNTSLDAMEIEIKGLKLTMNQTPFETAKCVVYSFLDYAAGADNVERTIRTILEQNETLIANFTSEDEAIDLIVALEDYFERSTLIPNLFMFTLHQLYQRSILDEDTILLWAENESKSVRTESFVNKASQFIDWLRLDDESSSEESEENGLSSKESE